MIRSAKEAKEFIYQYTKKPAKYPLSERTSLDVFSDLRKQSFCEGYLAALRGPEVKALIKTLEYLLNFDHPSEIIRKEVKLKIIDKALSQYREAVKDL